MTIRDMADDVYGSGEKNKPKFETWDDAIAHGNQNEQSMGARGKELLEEVLQYRRLGTPADINQALSAGNDTMTKLWRESSEKTNLLNAYKQFGFPSDVGLVYLLADALTREVSLVELLRETLDEISDQTSKDENVDEHNS